MLRGVVTSGTGKTANIDGYEVVGKTSTAEIAENGVYLSGIYNLAFTGFIDNSSSDLVCFVGANEVGSEANVCSIFKEIMQSAIEQYNIVPE
jgi:cell division protein FtsI (penicillin-binding protein 3)